jgi:hypothetical protein
VAAVSVVVAVTAVAAVKVAAVMAALVKAAAVMAVAVAKAAAKVVAAVSAAPTALAHAVAVVAVAAKVAVAATAAVTDSRLGLLIWSAALASPKALHCRALLFLDGQQVFGQPVRKRRVADVADGCRVNFRAWVPGCRAHGLAAGIRRCCC